MSNSPVTVVPATYWIAYGTEGDTSIKALKDIVLTYPDGHTDYVKSSVEAITLDGSHTSIDRGIDVWLICVQKNTTVVLLVEEYKFPTLDARFGGSNNWCVLGRVLLNEIVPYQNV